MLSVMLMTDTPCCRLEDFMEPLSVQVSDSPSQVKIEFLSYEACPPKIKHILCCIIYDYNRTYDVNNVV